MLSHSTMLTVSCSFSFFPGPKSITCKNFLKSNRSMWMPFFLTIALNIVLKKELLLVFCYSNCHKNANVNDNHRLFIQFGGAKFTWGNCIRPNSGRNWARWAFPRQRSVDRFPGLRSNLRARSRIARLWRSAFLRKHILNRNVLKKIAINKW